MKDFIRIIIVGLVGAVVGACSHEALRSSHLVSSYPVSSETLSSPSAPDSETPPDLSSSSSDRFFDWPVDTARMTRGFLPNRRKPHLGIDLAAPKGTNVYASHDGVIIYAGREFKGYGKMVMIEGKNGWATLYAHFSKILVKEGETVQQGSLIGAMGSTGRSTGSHVHFEIRRIRGPVDPLIYLPKASRLASNTAS